MKRLTLIVSACAMTWSAGALAVPASQQHGDQSTQARQSQSDQVQQQASRQSFSGQVIGMRTIALEGTGEDHAFAKVRLDQGGLAIVDLGPVRDLRDRNVRFRRNQAVTVQGHPGRVNAQPVIVAYAIESDGRRTDLARNQDRVQRQQEQRRRDYAQREQRRQEYAQRDQRQREQRQRDQRRETVQRQQTVSGRLEGYRTFDLRNERQPRVYGKVRTQDDQLVVMDLGTVRDLRQQQVDLQRGMRITGRGAAGRVNDMPVLVVSTMELDGERFRSSDRERHRQASQQASQERKRAQIHDQPAGGQESRNLIVMGKLDDLRDVSLKGVRDEHRMVKLDSFHRGQVVVDLGTDKDVQGLNLRKGDTVVISGRPARVNNLPVIRAEQVAEIASVTRTR